MDYFKLSISVFNPWTRLTKTLYECPSLSHIQQNKKNVTNTQLLREKKKMLLFSALNLGQGDFCRILTKQRFKIEQDWKKIPHGLPRRHTGVTTRDRRKWQGEIVSSMEESLAGSRELQGAESDQVPWWGWSMAKGSLSPVDVHLRIILIYCPHMYPALSHACFLPTSSRKLPVSSSTTLNIHDLSPCPKSDEPRATVIIGENNALLWTRWTN